MIRLLFLALLALAMPLSARTVTFKPSTRDFPNPERGFYRASGEPLDRLDPAWFDRVFAEGGRLAYARMDLSAYRTRPLPADYLSALAKGFAKARASGVKLIVRATYNYPRGETGYQNAQDAPLPVVLRHVAQLKPLFERNKDVIAVVQAGFIGAWGEWHTSSNGLTSPENRLAVRDALLAAVPKDRFVQFRYPPDLIAWTSTPPKRLRTGFHNDCFLASETDVGTFPENSAERERMRGQIATLTAEAPFGGETCNPADDPGAKPRTDCADILREGAAFHLTYLNADYYRGMFHDRWQAQGCMAEVRRRMGYRLAYAGALLPPEAARGGRWAGSITIRNEGWARPTNPRKLEIVLLGRAGQVCRLAVAADARTWLPGAAHTVPFDLALPAGLAAGTYDVALALPDADAALGTERRYAIRPANDDDPAQGQGWSETAGAFRTGVTITVR